MDTPKRKTTSLAKHIDLPYSGKCLRGANFEGRAVTAKIKTGPTHRYFTCKACGGCGFFALKREYYNCENFF